ncbi:MAG TPA: hypothetical protein VMR50_10630 [Myxococcota bacterium]|nr:hypothetical protein [Myxococcota bacterium]
MSGSKLVTGGASRRWLTPSLVILGLAVTALRAWQLESLPVITGDVVRNLLYGVAVRFLGVSAAASPLADLNSGWSAASWANLPYNYPPLTLGFFTLVSAVSATVFAAKLALTAIEAVNAVLVGRLTRSSVLGLLYWASPMSIWWVSREGQFEPLQSLFTLLALLAVGAAPLLAGLSAACAVQVKLTAILVLPWLAWRCHSAGPRALGLLGLGFAAGLFPALYAERAYQGVSHVFRYSTPLLYNPYYWDWSAPMFTWNPGWLVLCDELASYAMLAALVTYAVRRGSVWSSAAAIGFVAICKTHTNVQFWYFLLLVPLLVPIEDRRWRFALIACVPLLDVSSIVSVFGTPIGLHGWHGLPSVHARYEPAPSP